MLLIGSQAKHFTTLWKSWEALKTLEPKLLELLTICKQFANALIPVPISKKKNVNKPTYGY